MLKLTEMPTALQAACIVAAAQLVAANKIVVGKTTPCAQLVTEVTSEIVSAFGEARHLPTGRKSGDVRFLRPWG